MSDDVVERVARAIDEAPYFFSRRNKSRADGLQYEVFEGLPPSEAIPFDGILVLAAYATREEADEDSARRESIGRAQAAIKAMREPSAPRENSWKRHHLGQEPEMDKIIARRFGSRHDKPCLNPNVLTCASWDCQVADRCRLDAILSSEGKAS